MIIKPNLLSFTELLNCEELASYLNSYLCHDLISPISAINNLVELSEDVGFDNDIKELLTKSALAASYKLQFARMAYGSYGDPNLNIDLSELKNVANNFIQTEKIQLIWQNYHKNLTKLRAKLLLNLLLIAKNSILSEGRLTVYNKDNDNNFTIEAEASELKFPVFFIDLLENKIVKEKINARNIQFYYSLVLAKKTSTRLNIEQQEKLLIISG